MIENLALFWEFFSYPFFHMDSAGLFFDVICLVIIVYSVNWFIREVLACF